MRKGIDGLAAIVLGQLQRDPNSGDEFVFVGRQPSRLKALCWERDHNPNRHNRAALGDRLPTLIGIAQRTRVPRHLCKAFARALDILVKCRAAVCRPRSCPRICKSQYGRRRFEGKAKGKYLRAAA